MKRTSKKTRDWSLIASAAEGADFSFNIDAGRRYTILKTHANHAPFAVLAVLDAKLNHTEVWVTVRTTSWDWSNERTDLHDTLAHFIAIVFRLRGHSCSLWEVLNPAMFITGEVYAYRLHFEQGPLARLTTEDNDVNKCIQLLDLLPLIWQAFWTAFWKTPNKPNDVSEWRRSRRWATRIAKAIDEPIESEALSYMWRHNPTWMHFRSVRSQCIVLNCAPLITRLRHWCAQSNNAVDTLQGHSAYLIRHAGLLNALPFADMAYCQKVLEGIEHIDQKTKYLSITLDDRIVMFGHRHLVIKSSNSGRRAFDSERALILRRQKDEVAFLLPDLKWHDPIDAARFEQLVGELLGREPGVSRIRRVGPLNQPDGGRDHVADWFITPAAGTKIAESEPLSSPRRVIVQCKAYKKAVGADDVLNIRDTVEEHDCDGYFLAVSSQITVPLFNRLEKLRKKSQLFVDWWERPQIEQRLLDHPDLIAKYDDIVKIES